MPDAMLRRQKLLLPLLLSAVAWCQSADVQLGELTVCVIGADALENLDEGEWFGSEASDPYATLKVGTQTCSSVVLKDHSKATWNHCCSFGIVAADTPIHIVLTDMDDHGDDDLIGLACTSVHTGTRWLDLIRHDTPSIVGTVQACSCACLFSEGVAAVLWDSESCWNNLDDRQVSVVYSLLDRGLAAQPSFVSVNGSAGSRTADCPSDYQLTDCACLPASADESNACAHVSYHDRGCSGAATTALLSARCMKPPLGVTPSYSTWPSPASLQSATEEVAVCPHESTMVGCVGSGTRAPPTSTRLDVRSCAAVRDSGDSGGEFTATARCAAFGTSRAAFAVNSWQYESISQIGKPAVAYCPTGFHLSGCACFSEDKDMCKGATLTADGGCAAHFAAPSGFLELLQHAATRRNGIFAQARCLWLGDASSLLVLGADAAADAQATACQPLSDGDAQFERERGAFVDQLQNASGYDWRAASNSWWAQRAQSFDFSRATDAAAEQGVTPEAVAALMQGYGVQVPTEVPTLPSDFPESQSPVNAIKESVKQLPLAELQDAASTLSSLFGGGSRHHGRHRGSHDPAPPAAPAASHAAATAESLAHAESDEHGGGGGGGGGVGAFIGGMVLMLVLVSVGGGFFAWRQYKRSGIAGRPMLAQELATTTGSFLPPNLVNSPLQNPA